MHAGGRLILMGGRSPLEDCLVSPIKIYNGVLREVFPLLYTYCYIECDISAFIPPSLHHLVTMRVYLN